MNKWMNEWMGGRMDGWMDGWEGNVMARLGCHTRWSGRLGWNRDV